MFSAGFFKSISIFFWPEYNDLGSAKSFLCDKRGLTAEQADDELYLLMNMQAALLCRFYDNGLRGNHIRALKIEFPDFLKVSVDLFYPDGNSFDVKMMETLTDLIRHSQHTPEEILRLVMAVAEQHQADLPYNIDGIQQECLTAVKRIGGFSSHELLVFRYLVDDQRLSCAQVLSQFAAREPEIIELCAIESPYHRPLR